MSFDAATEAAIVRPYPPAPQKRLMAKAVAIFGMLVALLLTVVFGLDAAIGVPFGQPNFLMSLLFSISGAILAYMSWDAFRSAS